MTRAPAPRHQGTVPQYPVSQSPVPAARGTGALEQRGQSRSEFCSAHSWPEPKEQSRSRIPLPEEGRTQVNTGGDGSRSCCRGRGVRRATRGACQLTPRD